MTPVLQPVNYPKPFTMVTYHRPASPLKRLVATLALTGWLVGINTHAVAAERIALNFVNSDIAEVAKAIGVMTRKTFIIDPRVKGTLNIVTPQPVGRSLAYDILVASLRLQGFAAIETEGGVVRVVPETEAKQYAMPASKMRNSSLLSRGQIISKVIPLEHIPAAQVLMVLRPLVGANNAINADPSSNSLVIADYAENVAHIEEIIAGLDQPNLNAPQIIPLRYVSASEIAGLINRVFASAAPGAMNNELQKIDVTVDTRTNSLIVTTNNAARLARVQSLVSKLDVPTPVAGNVHVIYLKNAKAEKLAQTLRNILTTDTTSPQAPATAQAANNKAAPGSTPDLGPGMIQADLASNALIVIAPDAVFENIKNVVEKLDVRRAQVLVEALIAEVSADKAAEFGIQWMHMGTNGVIGGFGHSGTNNIGMLAANPLNALSSATQGFNIGAGGSVKTLVEGTAAEYQNGVLVTPSIPAVQFYSLGLLATALQTKANANILSTPTLLTLDNEEAKISVGSNVPFQTGSYQIATGGSASPFTTIERKDVGLILKVKPRITQGGTINMEISQEISKLREAANPTLSATDKRSIDSTVLVDDGQTIVIGGLIEEQVQDTEDRVPVLGDIPVLGNLFKYSTRKHVKTNLMVFLRPVILRDAEKTTAVSNARYDYILNEEKAAAPGAKPLLPVVPTLTLDRQIDRNTH